MALKLYAFIIRQVSGNRKPQKRGDLKMPRVNEAEEFKKLLTGFQRLARFYFAQAKNKKQRREIINSLRESRRTSPVRR
jgi:hypothetical protein